MKTFLYPLIAMALISSCCSKQIPDKQSNKTKSNDCLPDSISALVKGRKLLIENFGNIVSTEHTFRAVLSDDSIWHIIARPNVFENEQGNDTIPINRGSEMVLINKHNCKVIGFSIQR
jgi:hypothetical protein